MHPHPRPLSQGRGEKKHEALAPSRAHRGHPSGRRPDGGAASPRDARPLRHPRLRAGAAAAPRVHGVPALGHGARPRPRHLPPRRPALGPAAGRARGPHPAGGADRRAPAQPRGRHQARLLRQRAAHPARRHDHHARAHPDRRRALRARRARGRPRGGAPHGARALGRRPHEAAPRHRPPGHLPRAHRGHEPVRRRGRGALPRRAAEGRAGRARHARPAGRAARRGDRAPHAPERRRGGAGAGEEEPAEEPRHRPGDRRARAPREPRRPRRASR